jgi:hypothetical protein
MRALAVSAVVVCLLAAAAWLLGGFDDPTRLRERAATANGPVAEVPATDSLAVAPSSTTDSARRATDADSSASPADTTSDRWIVVEHETGAPLTDATVVCVDPSAEVRRPVVDGGVFEPVGVAPFLLEITAPGYAARWVVIDDDEPCAVQLRRAGALELRIVDESGAPFRGLGAKFVSEAAVSEDLEIVNRAILGAAPFGMVARDAVATLQAKTAPETFARFDPRHAIGVGPADCLRSFAIGTDGFHREPSIPSGRRYHAVVDDAFVAHSQPPGALNSSADEMRWVTEPIEVHADEKAIFRVVRRGSCNLTVSIDHAHIQWHGGVEHLLTRIDGPGAQQNDMVASPNPGRLRRDEETKALRWTGLDAGEYALALKWQRRGTHPSGGLLREYCMAQRRFTLAAGESRVFERIGPDPGLLELDIVFVDEHTRADVTADVLAAAERRFDLWCQFGCTTEGGASSWATDVDVRSEGSFIRLFGAPPGGRVLTVHGADDALDESDWSVVCDSTIELPSDASLRQRVEVLATRTHVCSITVVRPASAGPLQQKEWFTIAESRQAEVDAHVLLSFTASDELGGVLHAEPRLASGTWIVCDTLAPLLEFDSASPWKETDTETLYHVFGRFDVAAGTANEVRLVAMEAASAVLVHDASRGARLVELLRSARSSVQFGDLSQPAVASMARTRVTELESGSLMIRGLPPNALVRFEECDIEFHTGPPGSTIEVAVPTLASDDEGAAGNERDVEER